MSRSSASSRSPPSATSTSGPSPDSVKAYGHNGYFKSLEEVVHFYNTRDVEMWPPPEVDINVNVDEVGDLNLTADEEAAIVAFMRTLTDGYHP